MSDEPTVGTKLDVEVWRKVFGKTETRGDCNDDAHARCRWIVPPYSTDIRAAWEVLDKLRERGYRIDLMSNSTGWACEVWGPPPGYYRAGSGVEAPLAICRAALNALEHPAPGGAGREG